MSNSQIVQKLWNYCNILRDDGLSYGDYFGRAEPTAVQQEVADSGEVFVAGAAACICSFARACAELQSGRVTTPSNITFLPGGAYTLPDAAVLLGLPLERLRKWISGVALGAAKNRRFPAGGLRVRGEGRDRTFSFWTLIEIFSIAQLRAHGLSMQRLRANRQELAERFHTEHPFALEGLLTDGRRLLKELGDASLLELGTGGQTDFEAVVKPFCARLDFDSQTRLASRFYPNGRQSSVIVDPHHAFGRPVIQGTSITTEALACLVRGGEKIDDIASDFRLKPTQVEEAWEFERRLAA